jgi:hypothetical protein
VAEVIQVVAAEAAADADGKSITNFSGAFRKLRSSPDIADINKIKQFLTFVSNNIILLKKSNNFVRKFATKFIIHVQY